MKILVECSFHTIEWPIHVDNHVNLIKQVPFFLAYDMIAVWLLLVCGRGRSSGKM